MLEEGELGGGCGLEGGKLGGGCGLESSIHLKAFSG